MKKNLGLLFVCISLATLAYFVEERGDIERKAQREKETRIFDMQKYGDLKSFQTKNTDLVFEKKRSYIKKSSRLVDPKKLQVAFDELSKIRLKRILDNNEVTKENRKFFFPNDKDYMIFQFSLRKVKYLIGRKINTDRSFYLEIQKENQTYHVIAHNPSDVKRVVSKDTSEQDDTHYRTLKSILVLKDSFFEDLHVFKKMTQVKLVNTKEIYFTNKRNRPFRINVSEGSSLPNPPKAVKHNKLKTKQYLKELATIEALSVVDTFHPKDYYNKLAEIEFTNHDESTLTLNLFGDYKGKKGYYLLHNDKIYSINKKQINIFMANAQDFWTKTLSLPKTAKGHIEFPGQKPVYLKVQDQKQFKVETMQANPQKNKKEEEHSKRISHKEFQKIYNFLKTEADFISQTDPLTGSRKNPFQGITQSLFNLKLDNLTLKIKRTKGEVIVQDQTSGIDYHYITGGKLPFTYNPDEVLIK